MTRPWVVGCRRCGVRIAVAVTMMVGVGPALGPSAIAAAGAGSPVDAGEVVVADAERPSTDLTEGDSNTPFTLRLPPDASCPGDSANDDWRVQSFIIPDSDDLGQLRFGGVGPEGPPDDARWALYAYNGQPYVHVLLGQNAAAGEPGQVLDTPTLGFAGWPPGRLPSGPYRLGIACTYFRDVSTYWDTEIVVTIDPDIQPGEFRWSVASAPGGTPDADSSGLGPLWFVVGGLVLAVIVLAVIVVSVVGRRRMPRQTSPSFAKDQR